MAGRKGKSGMQGDFSGDKSGMDDLKGEKKEKKEGDFSNAMLNRINKAKSKERRSDLKDSIKEKESVNEDIEKKKNKKRRRPRRRKKKEMVREETLITEQKPMVEKGEKGLEEARRVEEEKRVEEKKEVEEPEKVEPISPFTEPPVSPFMDSELPPKEVEERYKEEMEPEDEGDNIFEEGNIKPPEKEDLIEEEVEPISPFEPVKHKPIIEKKALEDKPLDRREDEFKKREEAEVEETKTPEEVGESKEKGSMSMERDYKEEEESFQGTVSESKEKSKTEIIDVKAETIGGHVEPQEETVDKGRVEVEEFKEEFWDILAQAGITKKRLLYFFIFLIIAIFVIFFVILDGCSGDDKTVVPEDDKVVTQDRIITEVPSGGNESAGVLSSYIFGLEYTDKNLLEVVPLGEWGNISGVSSAFIFGGTMEAYESKIVYYHEVLRKMENIYNTDVYALLDMSIDRRAALDEHINEMSAIIDEAERIFEEVTLVMANFDLEYERIIDEREVFESEFFSYTDSLYGQKSFDTLEIFISKAKEAVEVKAYYNAYKLIRDMYASSLDRLTPRYQDIVANQEAIIKGIRVFDIPSSDIEAIVPL